MKRGYKGDFRKIILTTIILISVLNVAGSLILYGDFFKFSYPISAKAADGGELSLIIEAAVAPPVVAPPPEITTIGGGAPKKSQCSDGIDNDLDGNIDFPADKGCISFSDNSEEEPPIPPVPADVKIEIEELEPSEVGVPIFEITLTNLGEGILTVFIRYTIIDTTGDILIETVEERRTLVDRLILETIFSSSSSMTFPLTLTLTLPFFFLRLNA